MAAHGPHPARPLATRLEKCFVNLLPVTVRSFISFYPKGFKTVILSGLLLYVQQPHMPFTLEPYRINIPGKSFIRYKVLQKQI
jgi:hypothetical protein